MMKLQAKKSKLRSSGTHKNQRTPVVNFTNIFRAVLTPIFLAPKKYKNKHRVHKFCAYNICTKNVKMTPGLRKANKEKFLCQFQHSISKTCCLDQIKFISEDTIETATYLYIKIVYNIVYDALKSPRSEVEGRGIRLKIGLWK